MPPRIIELTENIHAILIIALKMTFREEGRVGVWGKFAAP
jgi:hypothetical protein